MHYICFWSYFVWQTTKGESNSQYLSIKGKLISTTILSRTAQRHEGWGSKCSIYWRLIQRCNPETGKRSYTQAIDPNKNNKEINTGKRVFQNNRQRIKKPRDMKEMLRIAERHMARLSNEWLNWPGLYRQSEQGQWATAEGNDC